MACEGAVGHIASDGSVDGQHYGQDREEQSRTYHCSTTGDARVGGGDIRTDGLGIRATYDGH